MIFHNNHFIGCLGHVSPVLEAQKAAQEIAARILVLDNSGLISLFKETNPPIISILVSWCSRIVRLQMNLNIILDVFYDIIESVI